MWHHGAVIYQIYPLSFQDSDGDGKGDLNGILARIDHLSWLGVTAVWLCPTFRSPMEDFGYDISNYEDIDPIFGSLRNLDELATELHARGIRVLLDLVPNHTSDEHPWFIESRSSRTNSRHDWYMWADARSDGRPPNNWLSRFGGPAWEWESRRQQFYYHSFLKSQPELNLRHPHVRAAIGDVMRFWLRRGIDGFRIDAAGLLAKDQELRDDPQNPEATDRTPPPDRQRRDYSDNQPESIDWLAEMRDVAEEFPERVLLGEVDNRRDLLPKFYGSMDRPALHLPLNYLLLEAEWQAERLVQAIANYLRPIPDHGWPVWAIGGQDKPRIVNKYGDDRARAAALLSLTLRGTALFFAGDEIGMHIVSIPSHEARDPFERLVPGYGLNRDVERTPMQWNESLNAGFTTGRPWLPLADDYQQCNVERQRRDPTSLLHFYRAAIALRRAEPALACGALDDLKAEHDVLTFVRGSGDRRIAVAINTAQETRTTRVARAGCVLLSTNLDRVKESIRGAIDLRANEGVVVAME
jgi:alpha-glucosidase